MKEEQEHTMPKGALVIGGGVAGVQSALDLANAGFKVFLVERGPCLGGRTSQIHKIFTSMDCTG
jgi:heterodisulfide reductase subunit A